MLFLRKFLIAAVLALFSVVASAAGPVDLNTASAEQIAAAIKGIGPKKAAAIVAYREKNGPFKSVDELKNVPGVGDKLLEDNRGNLTVGGAATGQTPGAKPSMPSSTMPETKPTAPPMTPPAPGSKPMGQQLPGAPKQ